MLFLPQCSSSNCVFQIKMTLSSKNGLLPVIVAAPNRQSPLKPSGPSMALVNASLAGDILRKLQAKNDTKNRNSNSTSSKASMSSTSPNETFFNNSNSGRKSSTPVSRPVIFDGSSLASQQIPSNVSSFTSIKAPPVPNSSEHENLLPSSLQVTQQWSSNDATQYVQVQGLDTVFESSVLPSDNVIVEELVEGSDTWGRYGGEIYLEDGHGQQQSSSIYTAGQFPNSAFFTSTTQGQVLASGDIVDIHPKSMYQEPFRTDSGYLTYRNVEDLVPPPSKRRREFSNNEFNLKEFFREDADTSEEERATSRSGAVGFQNIRQKHSSSSVSTTISGIENITSSDDFSHFDSHLASLSVKLIKVLRDSPDGLVDLKSIMQCLNSKSRRRVYDIVNVLVGIGLIEKDNNGVLIWKGGGIESNSKDIKRQVEFYSKDVAKLEQVEAMLDQQRFCLEQSLKNLTDDFEVERLLYVPHDQISKCFDPCDSLVSVEAPVGATVEFPTFQQYDDKTQFELSVVSKTDAVSVKLLQPLAQSPSRQFQMIQNSRSHRLQHNFFPVFRFLSNQRCNMTDNSIRLSPPPLQTDYKYSIDDSEGLTDLFL